ncbi:mediator of RNA polymerase II transcription subunit 14-like isoform X2 [Phoenix dactylifera]|uniref:Mediator of RNA polymerase II transcription subunit 14 n=1 Tax=Phoenix dactylifera TaxID=42345 RepID=A0A8B7BZB1_PHODC|nr:mediator of RNA polymerase II transcription subunit 14-like isoform X2 [Phoenix dactylifera]
MAEELGQQTVEFSSLVHRAAEESYLSLKELVERSKAPEERSDTEKKIDLLKFIVKTRQRMLRLHVLAKWCQQVPLVHYCQQLAATLSSHDTCFTQTADSLFYMHEGLQQARAPIFDVPSAIEVVLTGGYRRLPKCIEDLGIQSTLSKDEQKPALKKLDTLLRSKLLEISLPKEISDVTVSDGTVVLHVDGEFKVFLTVGYRGHLSLWRILHLELLVGEKNGPIKLEELRRYALGDDLERRMAVAENPFMVLYTVLHELCTALVMDTVLRQVHVLRQGRWRDAIRFELISDGSAGQGGNNSIVQLAQDGELDSTGLKIPGLKIFYWLDFDKITGGSDTGSTPFIKIEPGQDLQIKCQHSSFVLDPLTDREAKFSLNQSCIDVEKLLLRAIACNRHTHLLEIQRELCKSVQIFRGSGDVILKHEGAELETELRKRDNKHSIEDYCGDEVLRVRAYGASYITLGINIRNGRFLLQSSKNVLAPSALLDGEESLNQGIVTATEVFMSLRSKSILHLFASTGKFLGLKVYDQSSTNIKIPKSILHGLDLLLMGFPQFGNSYYLLMELDKDIKPVFNLLETQTDAGGKSHSNSDANEVIRFNKIDISQMRMVEDELNMSLFDWDKLHALPSMGACNQISEHDLLPEFGLEPGLQLPACSQSSFSSVVDEVFEFDKATSGPPFPIMSHLSASYNMSPLSHLGPLPTSHQGIKAGVSSPKWEGGLQQSQINNIAKVSAGLTSSSNSIFFSNNLKGLIHNSTTNSLSSSSPARNSSIQKLSASKSDQDLSCLKSPRSGEVGQYSSMDEDQTRLVNESPKELGMVDGSRSSQLLPPLRTTGPRLLVQSTSSNNFKSSSTGHLVGSVKDNRYSSSMVAYTCQTAEPDISSTSGYYDGINKHKRKSTKRSLSDFLTLIPSFQRLKSSTKQCKRRKISESVHCHPTASHALSSVRTCRSSGYMYGNLLAEPNHGITPSNIYVSVLLHVVRHYSLCIKHAQLTSQMDALDIPYVEEVGLRTPSSNLWLRVPFAKNDSWQHICLHLGKPGSMCWDVKINDPHFRELWELHKGSTSTLWGASVRIANTSEVDSHIHYDPEGVVLSYRTIEADSIQRLVSDLRRLSNARLFACGMRKLIGVKDNDKLDDSNTNSETKLQSVTKRTGEAADKLSEQMRKTFKIEAVGLMSLWFSYVSMPVIVHFVVEWEAGKEGCRMHVSPDQLWPHTKFLEDFVNGAEVASFLDCIRLTAGPLLALGGAIRPARMPMPVPPNHSPLPKQNNFVPSQGLLPNTLSSNVIQPASSTPAPTAVMAQLGSHNLHSAAMLSAAGRGGPGLVPSSLLPFDVSVVLRGPYWIRIIYRKKFAVDMRCFAGDQVWLQPATPPKGGPAAGGSLPCPQFRPFIMEHVAQGLNALEPSFSGVAHSGGHLSSSNSNPGSGSQTPAPNATRLNVSASSGMARTPVVGSQVAGSLSRVSNAILASSGLASGISGVPLRISPGTGFPVHVKGELNTAFIGLGDDGGYGGGWVPLAALKKVLRGILKYLGVLWLFAQLPDLLKEILGSILKENEGALLNLDQEQPALRFFVGGYVFAVSVHRVQLLLQVLSVKRFHHQQQQQQTQTNTQEELAPNEINEICDYFSRRVASEPYDASRVASFITLLTLPVSVLREFLKLIYWKKGLSQAHGGDIATAQRARIELCLENHSGSVLDENSESNTASKSNIHHDRAHNSVEFALTFVLDPAHIPHMNAAGGAAWLPYCVSVRLKYSFGENTYISFLGMDGSHGGRACWLRFEDWEKCKQRVARTEEYANGNSAGDVSQGRLRLVAETVQRKLDVSLQQLRDGALSSGSTAS